MPCTRRRISVRSLWDDACTAQQSLYTRPESATLKSVYERIYRRIQHQQCVRYFEGRITVFKHTRKEHRSDVEDMRGENANDVKDADGDTLHRNPPSRVVQGATPDVAVVVLEPQRVNYRWVEYGHHTHRNHTNKEKDERPVGRFVPRLGVNLLTKFSFADVWTSDERRNYLQARDCPAKRNYVFDFVHRDPLSDVSRTDNRVKSFHRHERKKVTGHKRSHPSHVAVG